MASSTYPGEDNGVFIAIFKDFYHQHWIPIGSNT